MRERYFVGTLSKGNPEIQAVYWFSEKSVAEAEARRQRDFYTKEDIVLCKVLNIPVLKFKKEGGKNENNQKRRQIHP
jgi:hypothetical protein